MAQEKLTLDALLSFDEAKIESLCPNGVILHQKKGKPDRYSPAESKSKAHRTLKQLLADKRRRMEPIYYLRQSYSVPKGFPDRPGAPAEPGGNYTTDPSQAVGVDKHGRGTPEIAVSPAVLKQYSGENWERFLAGLEAVDSRHSRLYVQRRIGKKKAA